MQVERIEYKLGPSIDTWDTTGYYALVEYTTAMTAYRVMW